MSYEDVGARIKERRKELNIPAAVLAERIGLSKATIHRYENGDIKNIKMPVLEAMAGVLQVNPLWLIGKSTSKNGHGGYDICIAIDEVLSNLKTYEDITCKGDPISAHSRRHIITALEIIRSALDVE